MTSWKSVDIIKPLFSEIILVKYNVIVIIDLSKSVTFTYLTEYDICY
jgi:hypothetical protein